jgi:chloride channel 3/4/5
MSIFSFAESYTDPRSNPYDISRYIDRVSRLLLAMRGSARGKGGSRLTVAQAPITVQTHSSLELVQQLFVKLGARQIMVTDSRGVFRGIISKKAWLACLSGLEGGH